MILIMMVMAVVSVVSSENTAIILAVPVNFFLEASEYRSGERHPVTLWAIDASAGQKIIEGPFL